MPRSHCWQKSHISVSWESLPESSFLKWALGFNLRSSCLHSTFYYPMCLLSCSPHTFILSFTSVITETNISPLSLLDTNSSGSLPACCPVVCNLFLILLHPSYLLYLAYSNSSLSKRRPAPYLVYCSVPDLTYTKNFEVLFCIILFILAVVFP